MSLGNGTYLTQGICNYTNGQRFQILGVGENGGGPFTISDEQGFCASVVDNYGYTPFGGAFVEVGPCNGTDNQLFTWSLAQSNNHHRYMLSPKHAPTMCLDAGFNGGNIHVSPCYNVTSAGVYAQTFTTWPGYETKFAKNMTGSTVYLSWRICATVDASVPDITNGVYGALMQGKSCNRTKEMLFSFAAVVGQPQKFTIKSTYGHCWTVGQALGDPVLLTNCTVGQTNQQYTFWANNSPKSVTIGTYAIVPESARQWCITANQTSKTGPLYLGTWRVSNPLPPDVYEFDRTKWTVGSA